MNTTTQTETKIAERVRTFSATDADGHKYQWAFRYSAALRNWILRDHTGYERILERNWLDSTSRIRAILANHGMTAEIS